MEKPDDGVAFIKAKYGVDLPKPMWSSYRAQQKARDQKKAGEETGGQAGPEPRQVAETGHVGPPKIQAKGDGDLLDALKSLKGLVSTHGVDKVKPIMVDTWMMLAHPGIVLDGQSLPVLVVRRRTLSRSPGKQGGLEAWQLGDIWEVAIPRNV